VPGAGSLTIVGTGIRVASQLTIEALDHIKRAERMFYLAGERASARWLQHLNPASETLADAYAEGRPRDVTYRQMTERILRPVRQGRRVVAAFYGHPGVGVDPAHAALRQARAEGYLAQMLPGISAEACLVADLGIDPLEDGWQSHEAWTFLTSRPQFDHRSPLLLWQLGLVYQSSVDFSGRPNRRGLRALTSRLQKRYSASHTVVLYEASPFQICEPRMERVPLAQVPIAAVSTATTLYVPPKVAR
jgi:uncharacterized protein YabN with tetrapyrrole methylase and pyrophosphatase domain